jgi:hypothetical protein
MSKSAAQLSDLSGWSVERCGVELVRAFVERTHYSHSVDGVRVSWCFALLDRGGQLQGAAIFGGMGTTAWRKWGTDDSVVELRRLCCSEVTPRNAESYLIGKCLRWIRRYTDIAVIVSYADPNHGHTGIIYRASNFQYLGLSADTKLIEYDDGRVYHDRSLRAKYNGQPKPFAVRLGNDLANGLCKYRVQKGKHTYIYRLPMNRKTSPQPAIRLLSVGVMQGGLFDE